MISELEKFIDKIKIPPAPFILTQLQQELQKEEPVLQNIAKIIAGDVGISALVLRTINSSFFNLRSKVYSIEHAINLLGIQYAINIVSGLLLRRTIEQSEGANPTNYWDSPANVAMIAANITRSIGYGDPDKMHVIGLFHNAGHALFTYRFTDYSDFLDANINLQESVITALEDRQYNTDHALLGYHLANTWGLDDDISEVIREHHNVQAIISASNQDINDKGIMLAILKMAEHVDKLFWGMSPDWEWEEIEDTILDYMGMSKPDFDDLTSDMLDKLISG